MGLYVDGFVVPLPKKNVPAYQRLAKQASKIWKEHGALEYRECAGDDLNHKGVVVSFLKQMKCKPNETVVFAWITYKSRSPRQGEREGHEGSTHRQDDDRQAAV